jgi:hypothetical protein
MKFHEFPERKCHWDWIWTWQIYEDKFDDPCWKEGLKLIKESFSNHLKGYGYEFKVKGDDGKWENLYLNFQA